MKMKKSIIKNLTEFDLEKIRRFTVTELQKISKSSELPFCYQVGIDTVIVGDYKVLKLDKNSWRVSEKGNDHFDFFSRKDAIFYCIALHKNDRQLAENIQNSDKQLNQLEFEAQIYRIRYRTAMEKGDDDRADVYSSRYLTVMDKIDAVKKDLTKSLDLAKYIKV